ncbi:Gfo/Idh/MocA family protein [Bacillus sp. 1P06AnD]|uniref:Gfo/Idh/MocA family protein n=1 Tax=Bacillus sp. 1P06AnD TaxID=3132208 RepID=UPI0039A086FE
MKTGIVGGGFGLRVQAPIIQLHPHMQLTAISTMYRHSIPEELKGNTFPFKHYLDWQEMLEKEDLDLVFVSSLPEYHHQIVIKALDMGINVVCEKPFAMNAKQALDMLEAANKTDCNVFVDFEWRYLPIRQKLKEFVGRGKIGKLLHTEYHASSPDYHILSSINRGWMGQKQHFGGMLGAIGTHMIDFIRWMSSEEMEQVYGFKHTHVPIGPDEIRDADDAFFISGRLRGGSTFSLQLLSGIHHGSGSTVTLYGTEGSMVLKDDQELLYGQGRLPFRKVAFDSVNPPNALPNEAAGYYKAFYPFLQSVYDYSVNGCHDGQLPTAYDGWRNQAVIALLEK